jgi:hypothetical protein
MISKHTSMVGVDLERKTAVDSNMVQRHVPLMAREPYQMVGKHYQSVIIQCCCLISLANSLSLK